MVAAAVAIGIVVLGGDDEPEARPSPVGGTESPSIGESPSPSESAAPEPIELANPEPITIADFAQAAPYPSTIQVTAAFDEVGDVDVTLSGLTHEFPDDVDVVLVGPGGASVVLLSDAGGVDPVQAIDLTFDDETGAPVADEASPASGTYRPTAGAEGPGSCCGFEGPPPAPAPPHGAELAVFDGTDPTGSWSLYVYDDTGGDVGQIAGGWSLRISPPGVDEPVSTGATGTTGASGLEVALQDDFSDPTSGWDEFSTGDDSGRYEAGTYILEVKQPGRFTKVVRRDLLSDLGDTAISVTARPLQDFFGSFYGVTCRDVDDDTYYEFAISTDGRYQIARYDGEDVPTFLDQGESPAINRGFGENLVAATCVGGGSDGDAFLALIVNGTTVAEIIDPNGLSATGAVGLLVGTEDAAPASVAFDDLLVERV